MTHFAKIWITVALVCSSIWLSAQQINWKESVIYQIYPRSFQDSNGDGIGDIKGITSRLDHLATLGVDIVWLSPIYKSPMVDMGYDVSDYRSIDPLFGTMADFDQLLSETHKRGMKLILDFVPNHTSEQHPWFLEAKQSKSSPYRDFYIWRSGKENGQMPSNWQSIFGGSAWSKTPETDEYYLHLFTKEQPDLNWDNPKVREAMYAELRFWLDKGIDGYRLDVIPLISKDTGFPDWTSFDFNTIAKTVVPGPNLHAYLKEMNEAVFSKYNCFVLGEGAGVFSTNACDFTDPSRKELDMVYHFDVTNLGRDKNTIPTQVTLPEFRRVVNEWDNAAQRCNGWNALLFGNHDQPRAVDRFGARGRHQEASAKMLAGLLLTMRGTPFIYQGDEIGMTNIKLKFRELEDVAAINTAKSVMKRGIPKFLVMKMVNKAGRDNARTPMQWSDEANAGFSNGPRTWLKVNPNHKEINVASSRSNPKSVLSFYQEMIRLRKQTTALRNGSYTDLDPSNEHILSFERRNTTECLLIVANYSDKKRSYLPPKGFEQLERLMGNYPATAGFELQPYEFRLYSINQNIK